MSLDKPFDQMPIQNELLPSDIGKRFSAIVRDLKALPNVKWGGLQLRMELEITATSSPKKYVGKVFDNYHGWGVKKVAGSQCSLAIFKMESGMGIKAPIEAIGREVILEQIPITESPNYRPSTSEEFEGEKYPRYYMVEFA